jgi:hypothetical protein
VSCMYTSRTIPSLQFVGLALLPTGCSWCNEPPPSSKETHKKDIPTPPCTCASVHMPHARTGGASLTVRAHTHTLFCMSPYSFLASCSKKPKPIGAFLRYKAKWLSDNSVRDRPHSVRLHRGSLALT